MALRVLLADESSTIKKVFQLVLQDYGVEVNAVTIGLDVVPVAQKFRPDILFADVLLQKRSGYDVCQEIKNNPELKNVPVVLIWSGFMELDEARYKACGANAHLEKPFDTQKLRQLVQSLVPKTKSSPVGSFLTFPTLPDFAERPQEMSAGPAPSPAPAPVPVPALKKPAMPPTPIDISPLEDDGIWSMEKFDPLQPPEIPVVSDADEFVSLDLGVTATNTKQSMTPVTESTPIDDDVDDAQWVRKSLANYKIPQQELDETPHVSYKVPEEKISPESVMSPPDESAVSLNLEITADHSEVTRPPSKMPVLDEVQLESLLRAQSQEIIEKVVWQIIPEIATRVIERELERLLKERKEQS